MLSSIAAPAVLTSYQDLLAASERLKPLLDTRLNLRPAGAVPAKRLILVCGGTGCHASESQRIVANFQELIEADGCSNDVHASISGCFGFCEKGPIVKIFPDDVFYVQVKPDDVPEIFDTHIHGNQRVRRLLYEQLTLPSGETVRPGLGKRIETQHAIPFYKKQQRIALRNCGLINPEDIDESIAAGGYQALGKALTEMTAEQVIDVMKRSGLRGRGGAGFPTGRKWEFARGYAGDEKFVICNADEGDPGAFMDRSIMEGDSNSVIEGMAIAAYAIGSHQGYVYIRAEYPLAIQRLEIAIDQARSYGLLGKNILGRGFDFDVAIKLGAGAFVCGEETALIHSMQGERGEPRTKPPFPAEAGLWGKPTIVNNVETLANVAAIINQGADWYSSIGTKTSKGTKVFALAGQVNNVGLVEVPMGTTLREIIFEIGGGIRGGHQFKAAQTGGPSGGCIPEQFLDTPIDYESLAGIGSIMGSGGLIVMSERDCMVNIAKFYLEFTMDESCGRCLPCRIGTKRLHEILTAITDGKGTEADLVELRELSNTIIDTALCGLGQGAPNPVLSTMKYFWKEYEAHVLDRRCPRRRVPEAAVLPDPAGKVRRMHGLRPQLPGPVHLRASQAAARDRCGEVHQMRRMHDPVQVQGHRARVGGTYDKPDHRQQTGQRACRSHHPRGRARDQHPHPDPVLPGPGRAQDGQQGGLVSHVRRGGRRPAQPGARVRHAGSRGHEGDDQLQAGAVRAAPAAGADPLQPSLRLPDLRQVDELRAADAGLGIRHQHRSATRARCRRTPSTRAAVRSSAIPRSASCAGAARRCATRCRPSAR